MKNISAPETQRGDAADFRFQCGKAIQDPDLENIRFM